jgi:predicted lipoprotein with Yx(FWY)xxD motif
MRHLLKLSIPAIAASLLIAACGSSSSSKTTSSAASTQAATQTSSNSSSAVLVKSASNSLGTILVDSQGMTLYHLSGEQNGKFICTGAACLQVWRPLAAQVGSTPSGTVGSLGTVKRPDGTEQVTYKGMPLYTFAQDQTAGQASGQGIKDVGTWSAVTVTKGVSTPSAPASVPAAPAASGEGSGGKGSSGGGSGGGYGY